MANPTIAKPTGYFPLAVTTASTVGENAVADIPLNTACYRETVGNLLVKPFVGYDGPGTGYPPIFNATGFTAGDVTNDPCITFQAGSTPLIAEGRGWLGAQPNPRTIWCVFRVRMGGQQSAKTVSLFGSGSDIYFHGIGFTIATNGTITLGQMGTSVTSASVTISRDKWYLCAISFTGATSRIIQVYNYTDQAYVTTQATGNAFTGQTVFTNTSQPDAVLNHQGGSGSSGAHPFVGDVYACGLVNATFDPATNGYFAALVADPCVISRGTYSGGGGVTAGGIVNASKNLTQIQIHSNRPSGGTPASYQFRLHRSTTMGFTPSGATQLGSLQSSPVLVDTTAAANTNYWYRVEQYDGTSTVYSTTATTNYSQTSGRLPRGEFFAITCGDSRWSQLGSDTVFRNLRAIGYRCGYMNMCLGSTSIYTGDASLSWQPNTTQDPTNGQASTALLPKAVQMATDCGNISYFVIAAGVNDSGTNNTTVYGTRYSYILNYLGGLGYKRVMFKPWVAGINSVGTEASMINALAYHAVIDGLADGVYKFSLGLTNSDSCMQGGGLMTRDNLHMNMPPFEAMAAAKDIDTLLNPPTGGGDSGGGGSRSGWSSLYA